MQGGCSRWTCGSRKVDWRYSSWGLRHSFSALRWSARRVVLSARPIFHGDYTGHHAPSPSPFPGCVAQRQDKATGTRARKRRSVRSTLILLPFFDPSFASVYPVCVPQKRVAQVTAMHFDDAFDFLIERLAALPDLGGQRGCWPHSYARAIAELGDCPTP